MKALISWLHTHVPATFTLYSVKIGLFKWFQKHAPSSMTPTGIMVQVVIPMYIIKVAAKYSLGTKISSVILIADGLHNGGDIVVALFVVLGVRLAASSGGGAYAFGLRGIESMSLMVTGGLLLLLALEVLVSCICGIDEAFLGGVLSTRDTLGGMVLPALAPDAFAGISTMSLSWFISTLIVICLSILLSWIVSNLQIMVGKKHAYPMITGDGKETWSDAIIEIVIAAGIISEYCFHSPAVEYLFGLGMCGKIAQTGWELLVDGFEAANQKSIGQKYHEGIRATAMSIRGIEDVPDVVTYRIGGSVAVYVHASSHWPALTQRAIKAVLKERIRQYLFEQGFPAVYCFVRVDSPIKPDAREACLVDENDLIARNVPGRGGQFLIVGQSDGLPRVECCDLTGDAETDVALLVKKRVRFLRVTGELPAGYKAALGHASIEIRVVHTPEVSAFGIPLE